MQCLKSQAVAEFTVMKKTFPLLFVLLLMALLGACVRPKLYRAELSARHAAEAREATLHRELTDRKVETANLTKQVGDLNRTLGQQQEQLRVLQDDLDSRTRQMGESASKLAAEKSNLERNLGQVTRRLEEREEMIARVQKVRQDRQKRLSDLEEALVKGYADKAASGVVVALSGETIELTLPDAGLFEANGLGISAAGKELLPPLANFLLSRPDLDADIVAYTDSTLPKDKSIKDTWDWSLVRANQVVRWLIQEYNVNANQLSPVGRGEFYPVASNETPEGRQKNRRTVVVVRPVLPPLPTTE